MEVKEVIKLVSDLHSGQMYGNAPFIVHLLLVCRHFTDPKYQIVALLHDVVEDTSTTLKEIEVIFGIEIAEAVDYLTHRDNDDYLKDYIPRVKLNNLARLVKLADLDENIYSGTYCYPGVYNSLLDRYYKAVKMLKDTE